MVDRDSNRNRHGEWYLVVDRPRAGLELLGRRPTPPTTRFAACGVSSNSAVRRLTLSAYAIVPGPSCGHSTMEAGLQRLESNRGRSAFVRLYFCGQPLSCMSARNRLCHLPLSSSLRLQSVVRLEWESVFNFNKVNYERGRIRVSMGPDRGQGLDRRDLQEEAVGQSGRNAESGRPAEVPAGLSIKAVEDTDKVFHLVIPAKPADLSDEDLEQVAGGVARCGGRCKVARCAVCCGVPGV